MFDFYLSHSEPYYVPFNSTDCDYVLRLTNKTPTTLSLEGEARIVKILGNTYGQPEHWRGPYPLYFQSHRTNQPTVFPGADVTLLLARRYLANIQENRYAVGLICYDLYTKSTAAYLSDESGIFELELTLWSVKRWWNRFFRWPREAFRCQVTGPRLMRDSEVTETP